MTNNVELDKTSMLYWHPRTKELDIPQPKTVMVELDRIYELDGIVHGDTIKFDRYWAKIKDAVNGVGVPFFMRTDHSSGKHDWERTCYVDDVDKVHIHIRNLIEDNLCKIDHRFGMMGLPYKALVFREYIKMASRFKAFKGMPISPERRYFVKDGEILCHHSYWIEDAIRFCAGTDEPKDWRTELRKMNTQRRHEVRILEDYAAVIGFEFMGEGCWSIDFCLAEDKWWYFIDMAEGFKSWHPESCRNHHEIRGVNK